MAVGRSRCARVPPRDPRIGLQALPHGARPRLQRRALQPSPPRHGGHAPYLPLNRRLCPMLSKALLTAIAGYWARDPKPPQMTDTHVPSRSFRAPDRMPRPPRQASAPRRPRTPPTARLPGHGFPAARGSAAGPLPARAAQARAAARRGEDRLDLRLLRLGAHPRARQGRRRCSTWRRRDRRRGSPSGCVAKSKYYDESRASSRSSRASSRATKTASVSSSSARAAVRRSWRRPIAAQRSRGRFDRAQHRAAARTGAQSLCHAVAQLPVPLFRAEEDALPAARARGRGASRAGSARSTRCSSC